MQMFFACWYDPDIFLLSLRNFTTFNSFLLMLEVSDHDFCNLYLTFYLNSIPQIGGRFGIMFKREFTMVKFKPILRTGSSWSVRTYSERLRTNF
jgi:hypothetical protein